MVEETLGLFRPLYWLFYVGEQVWCWEAFVGCFAISVLVHCQSLTPLNSHCLRVLSAIDR